MTFELESKTFKWLLSLQLITPADVKQLSPSTFELTEPVAAHFENGLRVGSIALEIYKKRGLPPPPTITHLKQSSGTAAQLYNWNILNDVHPSNSGIPQARLRDRLRNKKPHHQRRPDTSGDCVETPARPLRIQYSRGFSRSPRFQKGVRQAGDDARIPHSVPLGGTCINGLNQQEYG